MEEGKFATIEDLEIHYQTYGTGPSALLLIHGAVGKFSTFKSNPRSVIELQTNSS